MGGLTNFIVHSNVAEVLQRLDSMLVINEEGVTPGMLLLVGLPRTGKNAVLNHWMRREHIPVEEREFSEQPPIANLTFWQPQGNNFGSTVYVTPKTCIVFSELAYRLGEISSQYNASYGRKWYREPRSLYTDHQFTSLFAFVRSELNRLRIRAIVIRNAQWLDDRSLQMLLALRTERQGQLSIILSAQMHENADVDEPLADEFLRVPDAQKCCTRVELKRLDKRTYVTQVLEAMLNDLNLYFASDVTGEIHTHVPHAFWNRTQHDWKRINDVANDIQNKVPLRKGKRVISRAMLEEILHCTFDSASVAPTT